MLDLDELEAKAKAATPGPWAYCSEFDDVTQSTSSDLVATTFEDENGEFIATANPTAVLDLIRELREARAGLEYVRSYVESLVENREAVHAVGLLRDIDGFLAEKGGSHA